MPTNAEIKATIDRVIRVPKNPILTNQIAQILDDIIDNIGAGGTPGIDSVLAEGQALTANRQIDLNDKVFKFWQGDDHVFLLDPGQFKALISATQGGESGTNSNLVLYADPLGEGVTAHLVSQTGGNNADILLDGANGTITSTADTHTFSGIGGDLLQMVSGQSNGQLGIFRTFGGTLAGESLLQIVNNDDDGGVHRFNLKSNAGGPDVSILGDAIAQTLTSTAANGFILSHLAGGGTTGLSIDNDGKIIRTP